MKKVMAALLLATTIFASCKKLKDLTKFDLNYNTQTTIQAGVATALPFDVFTPDVTTESQSEFQGHNTASNLIESIKLKKMNLTITSPNGRKFDFLKDIEIYLSADGEEEILVAHKYDIPDTVGNELQLDAGTDDLKNYLTKDKYKLRLKVTTDKVINEDINVNIGTTFTVDANILGL
ncbi:MAG: hypothetical protein QM802_12785 [Agriterribacter sp.]